MPSVCWPEASTRVLRRRCRPRPLRPRFRHASRWMLMEFPRNCVCRSPLPSGLPITHPLRHTNPASSSYVWLPWIHSSITTCLREHFPPISDNCHKIGHPRFRSSSKGPLDILESKAQVKVDMKSAKFLFLAIAVSALAACAPVNHNVVSTDPSLIFVGENPPPGFPKEHIEHKDRFCSRIKEWWEPGLMVKGQKTWRKISRVETVECPAG